MPVAVAEVLLFVPLIGLGGVVRFRIGGCFDDSAVIEIQADVALQVNGAGEILSCREVDRTAARRASGINGAVDGGRGIGLATAAGAVTTER